MKVEVITLNPCKRELVVEVAAEDWNEEYVAVCGQFQRQARVPGFRPGRAPMPLVKQRYKDSIKDEFTEKSLRNYLIKALNEKNLSPLDTPKAKDFEFEEGQPLKFKAEFEILPPLEIDNYKGVEIERIPVEVKPEDVEHSLQTKRERMAEYLPVEDREVQAGDFAVVSYKSRFVGKEEDGPHAEEVYYEVGAAHSLPEFTEALTGMKSEESKTFPVKYPEDFPNKQLAGQELEYTLMLKSIKIKKLPELNDEFAKDNGHASLDELREKTRERIIAGRTEAAQSDMKNRVLERLVETNVIDVPEILLKEQVEIRFNNYARTLAARGIHPQTLDINWTEFQEQQRERAMDDVKSALILDYVGGKEKVEVSDEEVEADISRIAHDSHQTLEAARSRLTKDGGADRIKDRIRNRKTLDLLLEWATITEPHGTIIQP